MTKTVTPPMTPEAEAKERKLRWIRVIDGLAIIKSIQEETTAWRSEEYGAIRIRSTCDDANPSDPESKHEYGYSKGLDFEKAVQDYESGKRGDWNVFHGQKNGLLGCEQRLVESFLQTWGAATCFFCTDLVILITPKRVRCFVARREGHKCQQEPPAYTREPSKTLEYRSEEEELQSGLRALV